MRRTLDIHCCLHLTRGSKQNKILAAEERRSERETWPRSDPTLSLLRLDLFDLHGRRLRGSFRLELRRWFRRWLRRWPRRWLRSLRFGRLPLRLGRGHCGLRPLDLRELLGEVRAHLVLRRADLLRDGSGERRRAREPVSRPRLLEAPLDRAGVRARDAEFAQQAPTCLGAGFEEIRHCTERSTEPRGIEPKS